VIVALVAVAMVVGLVGTVLPVVPGLVLIAGAAAVYGLVEGFGTVGWVAMSLIALLGIAGTAAGAALPQRAAAGAGTARSSMALAVVGAVAGAFLIPVVGMPIGGALGIYLGERLRPVSHQQAWRSTVATVKGFGLATLVQLGAGVVMVLTWVAWVVAA
jgi:uncharacterized protein YqgC (DUF456 family)